MLGYESNRAWLVNDKAELVSAITEIFSICAPEFVYEKLTAYSVDAKIVLHCECLAKTAFGGEIVVKKLLQNTSKGINTNWDV